MESRYTNSPGSGFPRAKSVVPRRRFVSWTLTAACVLAARLGANLGSSHAYVPPPRVHRRRDVSTSATGGTGDGSPDRRGRHTKLQALLLRDGSTAAKRDQVTSVRQPVFAASATAQQPVISPELGSAIVGAAGLFALAQTHDGGMLNAMAANYASAYEDIFLLSVVGVTAYCLAQMAWMTMHCPHLEARVHTCANLLATFCSLYGIFLERVFRQSPDLWWAVLTPLLYGISNLTMSRLMNMYKGPVAYKRLFELGQSFTLSFQGIHVLAWSSIYPNLFWAAMPFWYWSLKKLVEPVTYMAGVVLHDEQAGVVEAHRQRDQAFGAFGLQVDAMTIAFAGVNLVAALIDNMYMGGYTIRGADAFFEVSRQLTSAAGWGSDHLRLALVKPAVGSLVVSMAVFLGTLVSRGRLSLAIGVPASALLSSIGPWVVFFWHRLIDPAEPWLPEFMGDSWGPGPIGQMLGF